MFNLLLNPRLLISGVIFCIGFAAGFSLSRVIFEPDLERAYEEQISNINKALDAANVDLREFDSGRLPDDFFRD